MGGGGKEESEPVKRPRVTVVRAWRVWRVRGLMNIDDIVAWSVG